MRFADNPALCYPTCLAANSYAYIEGLSRCPPSKQERAICAIVAATNISSIYSDWFCDSFGGVTNSSVCSLNGVECSVSGGVASISFALLNDLSGKMFENSRYNDLMDDH